MKVAITSMYANPLHYGHIECLRLSKELADVLVVIINNDHQAKLKRGTESYQSMEHRMEIVRELKSVDHAVPSIDTDSTVIQSITEVVRWMKELHGEDTEFIFTKGGDRFSNEIPEKEVCDNLNIQIIDGLGEKLYSSSDMIEGYVEVDLNTRNS